jgi:NIL domain.
VAREQIHVTFPPGLEREPTVYRLEQEFEVSPTIRRANVDENAAWFIVDLDGAPDAIEGAIDWLTGLGARVDRIPIDG